MQLRLMLTLLLTRLRTLLLTLLLLLTILLMLLLINDDSIAQGGSPAAVPIDSVRRRVHHGSSDAQRSRSQVVAGESCDEPAAPHTLPLCHTRDTRLRAPWRRVQLVVARPCQGLPVNAGSSVGTSHPPARLLMRDGFIVSPHTLSRCQPPHPLSDQPLTAGDVGFRASAAVQCGIAIAVRSNAAGPADQPKRAQAAATRCRRTGLLRRPITCRRLSCSCRTR